LLYYITDRKAFAGDEAERRSRLLQKIAEAARCGVDYIQLREKDLTARELESLAREAVAAVRRSARRTRLLINSRTDVAIAAGADGVHLRSDDVSPADVREAWKCGAGAPARETAGQHPIIGVSCHSVSDVTQAARNQADFAVFAPVFEKRDSGTSIPAGLSALKGVCRVEIPVFALGGVTLANAQSCIDAGAAGIAAIRLFQENDIAEVVSTIRG
jgi:thiamine-phosphate pyrophosphorylase